MQKVQNWKCAPAVIWIWRSPPGPWFANAISSSFSSFFVAFLPVPFDQIFYWVPSANCSFDRTRDYPIADCIPSVMLSLLSKRYDFTFLAVSVYWDTLLVHIFLGKHFYVKGWPKHHHRCALLLDKSMWSIVSLSRFRHCDKKMRFLFPAFSRLCKTNLKCHFK